MWSSPLYWIVFAIALFWALGAYNRLMRLRSAVVQSFGSFDAHMVRLLALLGEFHAAHGVQHPQASGRGEQEVAALHGAATQLSASLAVARARPLQPDALAGLAAARGVLLASWQGLAHKVHELAAPPDPGVPQESASASAGEIASPSEIASDAQALASTAPPPSPWQARWHEHTQHNEQAIRVFNDAVVQYNAAIRQFPANLLAWAFGFKAARGL